ncbi:RDD family protein [Pseudonocardia endophytica]|uniref:RDD family protein n=1 Tax=Pseudonocardia endophytica TaxID=401976 RepID=A0A4R1HSX4_PSEEN|nr:RDD family protein [Pseudonocardia endophytica]TCK24451.1 RDD family protein [Pseudonocardia endophytica]
MINDQGAAPTTRVTGRRIVQYVLDLFLAGIVLSVLGLIGNLIAPGAGFDQLSTGMTSLSRLTASGGWPSAAASLLTILVWLAVFVGVPIWRGRTPAMALLGLRIVRTDGTRPSGGQHLGRALLLVVDGFAAGLVGWIVMLCSRRRQRIGDHAAGTIVVRA